MKGSRLVAEGLHNYVVQRDEPSLDRNIDFFFFVSSFGTCEKDCSNYNFKDCTNSGIKFSSVSGGTWRLADCEM